MRFKTFQLDDTGCGMPITTDGVLLGAWARVPASFANPRIVDVGAGCGLLSLMLAQRYPSASVWGIEREPTAAEQATHNAARSPFSRRIQIFATDFQVWWHTLSPTETFDLIVSNPPYYTHGPSARDAARGAARYIDANAALTPESLFRLAAERLSLRGELALVTPYEQLDRLRLAAFRSGMAACRLCAIVAHEGRAPKRLLSQWRRFDPADPHPAPVSLLPIYREAPGSAQAPPYSSAFRQLTEEFYLFF